MKEFGWKKISVMSKLVVFATQAEWLNMTNNTDPDVAHMDQKDI